MLFGNIDALSWVFHKYNLGKIYQFVSAILFDRK